MFKEQYKKDNQMITPSQELLDKISAQMAEQVRLNQSGKAIPFGNMTKIAACAACACVVIGAAVIIPKMTSDGVTARDSEQPRANATTAAAFAADGITEENADETISGNALTAQQDTTNSGSDAETEAADSYSDEGSPAMGGESIAEFLPAQTEEKSETTTVETAPAEDNSALGNPLADDVEDDAEFDVDDAENDEVFVEDDVDDDVVVDDTDDDVVIDDTDDDIAIDDEEDSEEDVDAEDEAYSDNDFEYLTEHAATLGAYFDMLGSVQLNRDTLYVQDEGYVVYDYDSKLFSKLIDEISDAELVDLAWDSLGEYLFAPTGGSSDGSIWISVLVYQNCIQIASTGTAYADTEGDGYLSGFYALDENALSKVKSFFDSSAQFTFDIAKDALPSEVIKTYIPTMGEDTTTTVTADVMFEDGTTKQEKLHLSSKQTTELLSKLSAHNDKTTERVLNNYATSAITVTVTDETNLVGMKITIRDYAKPKLDVILFTLDKTYGRNNFYSNNWTLDSGEFEALYKLILGDNAPSGRLSAAPETPVEEEMDEEELSQ